MKSPGGRVRLARALLGMVLGLLFAGLTAFIWFLVAIVLAPVPEPPPHPKPSGVALGSGKFLMACGSILASFVGCAAGPALLGKIDATWRQPIVICSFLSGMYGAILGVCAGFGVDLIVSQIADGLTLDQVQLFLVGAAISSGLFGALLVAGMMSVPVVACYHDGDDA